MRVFRVSSEEVKTFFDLIDGDLWVKNTKWKEKKDYKSTISNLQVVKCRNIRKCFTNGQRIRHTIGINKTWIGIYDYSKNGIMYDTKLYKSLSRFSGMHYSIERPDRNKSANGWKECKCEVNGK